MPQAVNPKAAHYQLQLDQALVKGAWAQEHVALSPRQDVLPWAELFRKWDKHVHGGESSVTTTLAFHLRSLSLYLIPSPILQRTITTQAISISSPHHLRSHTSTTLTASQITPSELDGDAPSPQAARAVFLGQNPWDGCQVGQERRTDVENSLRELMGLLGEKGIKLSVSEKQNAWLLQAYHHLALGQYAECINVSQQAFALPAAGTLALSDHVAHIRGRVIEGLAFELASNLSSALASYTQAVHLADAYPSLSLPLTSSGPTDRSTEFVAHRELHRWVERALYRGALLASRSSTSDGLRWIRTWFLYESSWPGSFRPNRRAAIYALYLRALAVEGLSDRGSQHAVGSGSWTLRREENGSGWLGWTEEVAELTNRAFVAFDSAGKAFPKAGEKREEVEELVGGCVALWEVGGQRREDIPKLLQILWWATSQTFNSQPTLRYLTRLLLASSSPLDARRTFTLYVQLCTKARETAQGDKSIEPSSAQGAPDGILVESEFDDDRTFGEALLFGARLLGKECADPEEGLKMIDLALDVWRTSADGSLDGAGGEREKGMSRLLVVKAALEMSLVQKLQDPLTRPSYQASALRHLSTATELNPTSSLAFYHLAYAQAEAREIDSALGSVRKALELDPTNVESWHLLTLVLTAKDQWKEALEAVDRGLEAWDATVDLQDDAVLQEEKQDEPNVSIGRKDFGSNPHSQPPSNPPRTPSAPLLVNEEIPSSSTLLRNTLPPSLLPTRTDRVSAVLQLRITHALICERLEGAELASDLQLGLFSFYADTCGRPAPFYAMEEMDRRSSIFAPTVRTTFGSPSMLQLPEGCSVVEEMNRPVLDGDRDGDGDEDDGEDEGDREISPGFATITLASPVSDGQARIETTTEDSPSSSGSASPSASLSGSEHTRHRHFKPRLLGVSKSKRLTRTASLSKLHSLRHPSRSSSRVSLGTVQDRQMSTNPSITIQPPAGSSSALEGPTPVPTRPSSPFEPSVQPNKVSPEIQLLAQLWLLTAATCRRSGRFDQAISAIQEAELLDNTNPEVWVQLGLYYDVQADSEAAITSFTKALVFDPSHVAATVHLARLHLVNPTGGSLDIAHSLLDSITQEAGWDSTEAWYFLSKVCELHGGREERSRECLVFAARLEGGRCVRPVASALSKWK